VHGNGAVRGKLRCLSIKKVYTKMLRLHLFSIFTIQTQRALDAPAPLSPLNREDTGKFITPNGILAVFIKYTYFFKLPKK